MKVEFFDADQLEQLREQWNLLEVGEEMTAFQSHSWYRSLNKHYQTETRQNKIRTWFFAVAYEKEQAVMIAPLQFVKVGVSFHGIGTKKGIYFMGRIGYTDYCNFIYKDFSAEAVDSILDAVSKKYHTKRFCLELVEESSSLAKYICERYHPSFTTNTCGDLVLPETFDAYHSSLSKSMRQNIRTALNRQKRDNIVFTHEFTCDPLDMETRNTLMEIRAVRVQQHREQARQRTSWKGKLVGKIGSWERKLLVKQHNVMYEDLDTWCFLVKKDGEIAGFFWGIHDLEKKKYYVIYAGVSEKYGWYSPTISHFYEYLNEIYENGAAQNIVVFDFTRGGEKYKTDIGCRFKKCLSMSFQLK